jgi:hypothetical protein
MYQVTKLDQRYTGFPEFQYSLDCRHRFLSKPHGQIKTYRIISTEEIATNFTRLVHWAWETWGPSMEYKIREDLSDEFRNQDWCFISEKFRVLVRSTAQIEWFKLKWAYNEKDF